jgi:hypothetical protein
MEEIFVENNTVSGNEVLQARKEKACMLRNSSSVQTECRERCDIKFFDFSQKIYGNILLGKKLNL